MNVNDDTLRLFLGAIAVSNSWTLVTYKGTFIQAMEDQKDKACPPRFHPAVVNFRSYLDPTVPSSEQADFVFDSLPSTKHRIATVPIWPHEILLVMEDADAFQHLANEDFGPKELDFLWSFAQAIHVKPEAPVTRRCLG